MLWFLQVFPFSPTGSTSDLDLITPSRTISCMKNGILTGKVKIQVYYDQKAEWVRKNSGPVWSKTRGEPLPLETASVIWRCFASSVSRLPSIPPAGISIRLPHCAFRVRTSQISFRNCPSEEAEIAHGDSAADGETGRRQDR